MPRLRLEVTGVVQGVGFRWFARQAARSFGLAGWVRNSEDGSVEVVVEGSSESVEQFIAELRRGPDGAAVSEVRRAPAPGEESLPMPFAIMGRR